MAVARLLLWMMIAQAGGGGVPEELADPYVDGTYGFSIRPPKGWMLVRKRLPEARGVTLLRMVREEASNVTQEIVLKQTSTTRQLSMDEMLKRIDDSLELEFTQVDVQSRQVQQIAGRPGGLLTASFVRERVRRLRIEAIIEIKPRNYFVLLYDGPLEAGRKTEPLFHLVLASLRVLVDPSNEGEIREAMAAGETWLTRLTPADLKKAVIPEQFLRIEVKGRPSGLVAIHESPATMEGNEGVRVTERGWRFEADGLARRLDTMMFVSLDQKHERWRTAVTTLVPSSGTRPAALEQAVEEGLRSGDVLVSSQTYHLNEAVETNPVLHVPPSYASRALIRLLPGLAKLSERRKISFVTFDHGRAALVARIVEFRGRSRLPVGANKDEVFVLEDREGLAADPSALYVDGAGRTLYVKAGDVQMVAAGEKELERQFADQIHEAQRGIADVEAAMRRDESRFGRKAAPP